MEEHDEEDESTVADDLQALSVNDHDEGGKDKDEEEEPAEDNAEEVEGAVGGGDDEEGAEGGGDENGVSPKGKNSTFFKLFYNFWFQVVMLCYCSLLM